MNIPRMLSSITRLEKKEPKTDQDITRIKSDIAKLKADVKKIKEDKKIG